jgi:hypothetical protein
MLFLIGFVVLPRLFGVFPYAVVLVAQNFSSIGLGVAFLFVASYVSRNFIDHQSDYDKL